MFTPGSRLRSTPARASPVCRLPPAGRGDGPRPRQDTRVCSVPSHRRSHPGKSLPSGERPQRRKSREAGDPSALHSHLLTSTGSRDVRGKFGEERVPCRVPLRREGAEHPAPSPRRVGAPLPTEGPGRGGQRHLRGDPDKAGGGGEASRDRREGAASEAAEPYRPRAPLPEDARAPIPRGGSAGSGEPPPAVPGRWGSPPPGPPLPGASPPGPRSGAAPA